MSGIHSDLTAAAKSLALDAGFARVGVAPAGAAPHAEAFERWLAAGFHADMRYMARNVAMRRRPDLLVPGARSVICLVVGYADECAPKGQEDLAGGKRSAAPGSEAHFELSPEGAKDPVECDLFRPSGARYPEKPVPGASPPAKSSRPFGSISANSGPAMAPAADQDPTANPQSAIPLVARFARGRDYHKVLKRRCILLMDRVREQFPKFAGRAFVDSGPVMERSLAAAAGVGWIGRNGCLFAPGLGSYVLLCEIISNLPLVPDVPIKSQCDDCGRCVKACPTGALGDDGLVDARLCISYQTIENRGEIPPGLLPKLGRRIFGCDACQEACPHNHGLPPGDAELIGSGPVLGGADMETIRHWSPTEWDAATRGRTLRRATCEIFRRNAAAASGAAHESSEEAATE